LTRYRDQRDGQQGGALAFVRKLLTGGNGPVGGSPQSRVYREREEREKKRELGVRVQGPEVGGGVEGPEAGVVEGPVVGGVDAPEDQVAMQAEFLGQVVTLGVTPPVTAPEVTEIDRHTEDGGIEGKSDQGIDENSDTDSDTALSFIDDAPPPDVGYEGTPRDVDYHYAEAPHYEESKRRAERRQNIRRLEAYADWKDGEASKADKVSEEQGRLKIIKDGTIRFRRNWPRSCWH
jgi:hypothetical protein